MLVFLLFDYRATITLLKYASLIQHSLPFKNKKNPRIHLKIGFI